jgi:hypothetical protein
MNIVFFLWVAILIVGAVLKAVFKDSKHIKTINKVIWSLLGVMTLIVALGLLFIINRVLSI